MSSRFPAVFPAVFALLLLAVPLRLTAAEPPACDAGRVGSVTAMAGKRCVCRYERGGTLTGEQPGYRWDCGILRPADRFAPLAPGAPVPDWLGPVIVDQRSVRP